MMRIFTFVILTLPLISQTSEDYGFADESIPELEQFEYYRGIWKAKMEYLSDDGTFKKLENVSTIKGHFLDDHRTYQSQFTTEAGFFSTDLRTYNTSTKTWDCLFLNAKAQRWHKFSSSIVDGKMTTIVPGGYSGKEDFDIKVIDTIINESYYKKHVYKSTDNMKTWTLTYKIDVKKVN